MQERALFGSQNAAQKVIDGVTIITEAVTSVGSQPTRVVSNWVADQIRPSYWKPNHEIKVFCMYNLNNCLKLTKCIFFAIRNVSSVSHHLILT